MNCMVGILYDDLGMGFPWGFECWWRCAGSRREGGEISSFALRGWEGMRGVFRVWDEDAEKEGVIAGLDW